MRAVAIDWSGRMTAAAESIWIAEADGDRLTVLENGREPDEVVAWLSHRAPGESLVAGIDFSFSFPAWFVRERYGSAPATWAAMAADGPTLLAQERFPFWGRSRSRWSGLTEELRLRATESGLPGAKSTFQIGGAGAVGTGSVRGMAILPALRAAGFAIWPFDPAGARTVVEIYPRALYGSSPPVVKTRWRSRHEALGAWFPSLTSAMHERAAGSQDAFDAAVSALVLARHPAPSGWLGPAADPEQRSREPLEGRIWVPPGSRSSGP